MNRALTVSNELGSPPPIPIYPALHTYLREEPRPVPEKWLMKSGICPIPADKALSALPITGTPFWWGLSPPLNRLHQPVYARSRAGRGRSRTLSSLLAVHGLKTVLNSCAVSTFSL